MSDGPVLKAEKDFSAEVDKQLPKAQELAKVNWTKDSQELVVTD
jgi:hypothetical protein